MNARSEDGPDDEATPADAEQAGRDDQTDRLVSAAEHTELLTKYLVLIGVITIAIILLSK